MLTPGLAIGAPPGAFYGMPRTPGTWSSEEAKEMTLRSVEARRLRAAERQAQREEEKRSFDAHVPRIERQWEAAQLQRVRVLAEKVACLLLANEAPRDIRDLACALTQLHDQERELARDTLTPANMLPAASPIIEIAPDIAAAPVVDTTQPGKTESIG